MSTPSQPNLITLRDPRSPASEAYRTLRTNLQFTALRGQLRTLIVTTPGAGEGKSSAAANLAVTMAQAGRRVILVDADLRRPAQHELFGVAREPGLSDTLLDPSAPPVLRESGVEGLRLLTAGSAPPNPAELLASETMEALVTWLANEAEIVIFDAPPVVPVTDAAILGARTDGVLLVIQAGKTKRDQAARARTLLEQVGARLIGTALTNARVRGDLTGY